MSHGGLQILSEPIATDAAWRGWAADVTLPTRSGKGVRMTMSWRRRTVHSGDVALAVFESPDNGPTIVLVHGYPDTHVVWDLVADRLAPRFHCVAYDVRGAGDSDAPDTRDAYRLSELRADLATVMDEVSPDAPVHLVGHDWGSIQGWDTVIRIGSDPAWRNRIASFTTISGPCLQHVTAFRRSARTFGWSRRIAVARQGLHSWYVFAFHVPWLPERVLPRLNRRLLATRDRSRFGFADSLPDDSAHGLELYRANIFHRERLDGPPSTDVPVLLVRPTRDKYVTAELTADVGQYASDLTEVEIDAGHWVPRTAPDEAAAAIGDFVAARLRFPPSD